MANYGFKVSKIGDNVTTASDKDLVLTSKYSTFKGTLPGSGTATFSEDSETTVTISHGLSYIPSVFMLVEVYNDGNYYPTPFYDSGALYQQYYYAYADTSNVYLVFYEDYGGSTTINRDYSYRIYIDKGKL